jgi:hypothetical protein
LDGDAVAPSHVSVVEDELDAHGLGGLAHARVAIRDAIALGTGGNRGLIVEEIRAAAGGCEDLHGRRRLEE